MMEFGEFLRWAREKEGLGVRELARIMGVTPTYISRVENGHMGVASSEFIIKLGKLCDFNGELASLKYGKIPENIKLTMQIHALEVLEALKDIVDNNTSKEFQVYE